MTTNSLFKRFIIQSIISFIITGGLLAFFVSNNIIKQEINHNIEIVNLTLGHSLEHWFDDVDLYNITAHEIADLDNEFLSLSELGNIADIRIWRLDGVLAYSQDKTLINTLHMETDHLEVANQGQIDFELTIADSEENIMLHGDNKELIEIYLPIKDHNEIIGVFEVYRSFDTSRNSINSSIRYVLLILSVGLIILYFLLAKTIHRSSNKLTRQKDELSKSYTKLNKLFKSMVQAITKAIDARDKFTSGHSQRVAEYTTKFAKYLDLDKDTMDNLEIAALLHDIGKLGVPESIINKPGTLSDCEFDLMRQHPLIGEEIIKDINEFEYIIDIIKHHHEKFDGKGYPDNLVGENIPYLARIMTITDAFDAMTSNRPYRNGLSIKEALLEIEKYAGHQFDPTLAKAFIAFIKSSEIL